MHIPVLLKEVVEILDPKPGEFVVDLTVDGGGHAFEFAKKNREIWNDLTY